MFDLLVLLEITCYFFSIYQKVIMMGRIYLFFQSEGTGDNNLLNDHKKMSWTFQLPQHSL